MKLGERELSEDKFSKSLCGLAKPQVNKSLFVAGHFEVILILEFIN